VMNSRRLMTVDLAMRCRPASGERLRKTIPFS
jgi:hypothetical protein